MTESCDDIDMNSCPKYTNSSHKSVGKRQQPNRKNGQKTWTDNSQKDEIQITNKQMETCFTSFPMKKMQIKNHNAIQHLKPSNIVKTKKMKNTKFWQRHVAIPTFICCWWEYKLAQPLFGHSTVRRQKPHQLLEETI